MKKLNENEMVLVSAGMDTGTCTAVVIGGSALAGGAIAGYFSLGTGFGVGAKVGAFYGIFLAAYACN